MDTYSARLGCGGARLVQGKKHGQQQAVAHENLHKLHHFVRFLELKPVSDIIFLNMSFQITLRLIFRTCVYNLKTTKGIFLLK